MFLIVSGFGFHVVYKNSRSLMQSYSINSYLVNLGDATSIASNAVYSIVWLMAWWMFVRKKPAAGRWAIAANLILMFPYLPGIFGGNWRGVLKLEIDWLPFILIGIFGVIIFSIPYHGWRGKPDVAAE
ncbi:MAG TPA: hypothetical protein VFU55_10620 [Terracidiphilus sp.]|nr:hypothetical protein [Terracidiphilus sp.]